MTELEQLQAELAQTKALLWQREQLLANTEQGIWHLDNAGLTVFVNPAMCRLLGRERDDVMGHRVFDFFSGPDLAILNEQLERRKQGHKKGYEIGLVRPDGTRVECFNNATPIFDAAGVKQGSVGMWTDLTPLKQTQRELDAALADSQAQRAEYEALLASFPGLIAVVDQDGRYVYVNQAQADLFGLPAAEVIGRTMLEMRGPERAALLFAEYPRLRAGEVIRDIVEHPARGDRPAVTVRVNRVAAPPREHGQHYYAFSIDITDILKGEARSNFLARMSHEIRTPMHAIIGLTAVTLGTELTPEQQDYLGRVHMAGQALMGLLDEVLDLSKIDAGKVHMEVIPFDLKSILDGTAAVLAQLVKDKGLNLRLSCPPEVPRQLLGDPTRLRQVLTNLISNARKFTDKGDIVVSVALASAPQEPLVLRFSVRDSGLGMTAVQLAGLFQPYVQADVSISRTFGGTGLGLAISRQLVELMGGRIWANSEPGQGSTFSFELPFTQDVTAHTAQAPDASHADRARSVLDASALAAIKGARILLVEDNVVNQLVGVKLLTQAGFQVEVAHNGQQALDRLAQAAFDCVLMDLDMPVMDGYEATTQIRANPAWAALPVLALSASVLPEDRARAARAGVNGHIAKPLLTHDLMAALLQWVPVGQRTVRSG